VLAAPAGWGKSALLSAWGEGKTHADCERRPSVAWVSLDAGDNDPVRFWSYVLTALEQAQPGVAENALKVLRASQTPAIEAALTVLLNAVAALSTDMVLVLDDYHLITAAAVHASLTYLLAHMPPQLHLVLASREDPPLPLARQRAGGSVCELRAADLRFTSEEASAFLAQSTGVSLPAEAVQALETCTEGWIAGLQLAALSVQGRSGERASEFIAAFGGSNRYIVDYLVEEVLARQPPEVTSFLLRTAVLDRFCAPLCDVLLAHDVDATARAGRSVMNTTAGHVVLSAGGSRPHHLSAEAILERVERANLFLVPLDDERRWYRYHHLFADVMRSRLRQTDPGLFIELHRCASAWFERQDLVEEAVGHALAAADFEQAATLLTDKRGRDSIARGAL
jgi:LuxR family maltose regulon positive regulatory protein